jgi:hypothetical protein
MPLTDTERTLIESTYAAFSKASRPAPGDITPHRCEECDAVRDLLAAYSVQEVPDEAMESLADALPLLTASSLRYFLPRFIEYGLTHPDSIAREYLIYHLSEKRPSEQYWVARIAAFSPEERNAVVNYLALPDADDFEEEIQGVMALWSAKA